MHQLLPRSCKACQFPISDIVIAMQSQQLQLLKLLSSLLCNTRLDPSKSDSQAQNDQWVMSHVTDQGTLRQADARPGAAPAKLAHECTTGAFGLTTRKSCSSITKAAPAGAQLAGMSVG